MRLSELFPMIKAVAAEFGIKARCVSADYSINERTEASKPYVWHNYNVYVQFGESGDNKCFLGRGQTPQLALEDLRRALAVEFKQPEILTQTEEPDLA